MTRMETGADHGLVAREILALTRGGTLHVRGIADLPPDMDATFYDDAGIPTFVTTAQSSLVAAARQRRGAVLAIPADTATGYSQLVLGGHLVVLTDGTEDGTDDDDDDVPAGVVTVVLLVHTVVLERDDADSPTVGYRSVALADWTNATPDPLRPAAQRIVRHTNQAHAGRLRTYVAGLRAIPATDVLAAELADLDATGVDLCWLDSRGAHRARVRFDRPAECPGELAARLRDVLTD